MDRTRTLTVVLAGLLLVATAVAVGATTLDTRVGGNITVAADDRLEETVTATGGRVIVNGTVDGDLHAYGGNVRITESGEVTGIVRAYGGSISIAGAVGESALGYGGTVRLAESGTVDGSYGAVASTAVVAGTVDQDVNAVGGTVRLADTAEVGGNVVYRGTLEDRGGTVGGQRKAAKELSLLPPLALIGSVAEVLLVLSTFALGTSLLYVTPAFADEAVRMIRTTPLRTGVIGALAVAGTTGAIGLTAVTIVGLPLAVAALLIALVLAWVALTYGQYVIGHLVLSRVDVTNRYFALVSGVLGVSLLGLLPYIGPVIETVVFLLGAGVLASGIGRLASMTRTRRGGR